jgi:hypothetical protein
MTIMYFTWKIYISLFFYTLFCSKTGGITVKVIKFDSKLIVCYVTNFQILLSVMRYRCYCYRYCSLFSCFFITFAASQ